MPQRDEGDNGIYGVDPAWLHEVLLSWHNQPHSMVPMPEGPSADFMNEIYRFVPTTGVSGLYYKSAPSEAIDYSAMESFCARIGEHPSQVSRGDPVRRSDIEDVFDAIKEVSYIRRSGTFPMPSPEYATETGYYNAYPDGGRDYSSTLPKFIPAWNDMYRWDWSYYDFSGGAWEHWTGGSWQRSISASFPISISVDCDVSIFDSAVVIGRFGSASICDGSCSDSWNTDIYIPLPGTLASSGDRSGIVTATMPSGSTIHGIMGLSDPPFQHSSGMFIGRIYFNSLFVLLHLAPDYRHP